jgi:hypothetical protein
MIPAYFFFIKFEPVNNYEVALSGNDDYLITGNKSHFPQKNFIISPTDFLSKI